MAWGCTLQRFELQAWISITVTQERSNLILASRDSIFLGTRAGLPRRQAYSVSTILPSAPKQRPPLRHGSISIWRRRQYGRVLHAYIPFLDSRTINSQPLVFLIYYVAYNNHIPILTNASTKQRKWRMMAVAAQNVFYKMIALRKEPEDRCSTQGSGRSTLLFCILTEKHKLTTFKI